MPRTDATELPEIKELKEILAREAQRPIAAGKEGSHFAKFDLVVRWFEALGLPVVAFTSQMTWQEFIVSNPELPGQAVAKTLEYAGDLEFEKLMREITAYLGEQDEPQRSDAIFVFGSRQLKRIEAAVDLYKRNFAPRIFITGGMPIYETREKPEAIMLKEWAVEHGVPADAIGVHETAISIADNVRGGLNEMDKLGMSHDRLILVTAWFAMRRSWAHMMKYVSESTKLYRVTAPFTVGGDYDPSLWWKNKNGINMIFNEFAKLRISELLNTS